MPKVNCACCGTEFYSKHSVAKYCSKQCAGRVSGKLPKKLWYSSDQLLDILRHKAGELGKTPSQRDVFGYPNATTYKNRFGSWNLAVIEAGLTPNIKVPKTFTNSEERFISLNTRYTILKRDGFRCKSCGGTPALGYVLNVDHIISRKNGGKTLPENLQTLCWMCNMGKGST